MRQFTSREFTKILKNNGYELLRNGKGSHTVWSNGKNNISVPDKLYSVVILRLIKENRLKS